MKAKATATTQGTVSVVFPNIGYAITDVAEARSLAVQLFAAADEAEKQLQQLFEPGRLDVWCTTRR